MAKDKQTALEAIKIDGKTFLESVMEVEASESRAKLKIADMTPIQVQRCFRARLRHEIAAIRKDRAIALKQDLERITAEHFATADVTNVTFGAELQQKILERKLAEKSLIEEAISAQMSDNTERMRKAMRDKFDYASVVGNKSVTEETEQIDTTMEG